MRPTIALLLATLFSNAESLRLSTASDHMNEQNGEKCGIVLGSFGKDEFIDLGLKVAKYIRDIDMSTSNGWCPGRLKLDYIPVSLFTDKESITCPEGVTCLGVSRFGSYNGNSTNTRPFTRHLGSWKFRWYHAQMMVKSPYPLTMYVDLDALPCSGKGVAQMFRVIGSGSDLGSIIRNQPAGCQSSPDGSCTHGSVSKAANFSFEMDRWSRFRERNAGVIVTDLRKTRPMFKDWATLILESSSIPGVRGDQYSYRQAVFKHSQNIKEHVFSPKQVCREYPVKNCSSGCFVHHGYHQRALEEAGIIPNLVQKVVELESSVQRR